MKMESMLEKQGIFACSQKTNMFRSTLTHEILQWILQIDSSSYNIVHLLGENLNNILSPKIQKYLDVSYQIYFFSSWYLDGSMSLVSNIFDQKRTRPLISHVF